MHGTAYLGETLIGAHEHPKEERGIIKHFDHMSITYLFLRDFSKVLQVQQPINHSTFQQELNYFIIEHVDPVYCQEIHVQGSNANEMTHTELECNTHKGFCM